MRITSSHHRSLSSASPCSSLLQYLRLLFILVLLVTLQAVIALAQSDGYFLYWKKTVTFGGGNQAYELAHKLIRGFGITMVRAKIGKNIQIWVCPKPILY